MILETQVIGVDMIDKTTMAVIYGKKLSIFQDLVEVASKDVHAEQVAACRRKRRLGVLIMDGWCSLSMIEISEDDQTMTKQEQITISTQLSTSVTIFLPFRLGTPLTMRS